MAIISLTLYGLAIKCLYSPRIVPLCGIVTVESVPPPLPIFYNIITYDKRATARAVFWLIVFWPSKRDSDIRVPQRPTIIFMCSAFHLFTLERIASRLNTFHLPKATSHDKMVYGRMMYSLGYRPCALSVRLDGSSSAACPWGLSLKCKHIIACDCSIIYSKKNNKHFFADFTHLCNIYTINLRNGADELVQY